jgi:hypothetical protein
LEKHLHIVNVLLQVRAAPGYHRKRGGRVLINYRGEREGGWIDLKSSDFFTFKVVLNFEFRDKN